MTEHPIIFSGPMVRAILEGRKTQTRRLIKPQPDLADDIASARADEAWAAGYVPVCCPYGKPGDLLWVRETWCPEYEAEGSYLYRATCGTDVIFPDGGHWRPSIHMPRRASRITLRVTDVRVQRLHDITEQDAQADGVVAFKTVGSERDKAWYPEGFRASYRLEWNALNGKRAPWESNPWVWAITFERVL